MFLHIHVCSALHQFCRALCSNCRLKSKRSLHRVFQMLQLLFRYVLVSARLSVTKDVTRDASLTYLPASFAGCARYEASCYCSSKCDRGHCGNKLYCVFGNCNWETASRSSVIYQSILYASRRSCCSLAWGLMGSH